MGFSPLPAKLLTLAGFYDLRFLSFVFLIYLIGSYFPATTSLPGWTGLMTAMTLFLSGVSVHDAGRHGPNTCHRIFTS